MNKGLDMENLQLKAFTQSQQKKEIREKSPIVCVLVVKK